MPLHDKLLLEHRINFIRCHQCIIVELKSNTLQLFFQLLVYYSTDKMQSESNNKPVRNSLYFVNTD